MKDQISQGKDLLAHHLKKKRKILEISMGIILNQSMHKKVFLILSLIQTNNTKANSKRRKRKRDHLTNLSN